jgi:hypothetical protein
MNCREFGELWDDLLDARWEASSQLERSLEAHASDCSRCRAVSGRYQVLRQAISGLRAPTPSAESIERLYALTVPASPPTIPIGPPRPRHRLRGSLVAAASFALIWLGGGGRPAPEPSVRPAPGVDSMAGVARRPLGLALADATEATLDLAREASAPASRIGREMFGLDEASAPSTAVPSPALADESANESRTTDKPAPGLLKAVGDRVVAGVGPISGSARHAFSFLLGPAGKPGPGAAPRKRDSL